MFQQFNLFCCMHVPHFFQDTVVHKILEVECWADFQLTVA